MGLTVLAAIEFPVTVAQGFPAAVLEWGVLGGLVMVALALVRLVERKIDRKNGTSLGQIIAANTEQVRELRQNIERLDSSMNSTTTVLSVLQKDVDLNSERLRRLDDGVQGLLRRRA